MTYLVVGFGYWGRGPTEAEALKQAQKEGLRKSEKRLVFTTNDPKPSVDGYGSVCYGGKDCPDAWLVLQKEIAGRKMIVRNELRSNTAAPAEAFAV